MLPVPTTLSTSLPSDLDSRAPLATATLALDPRTFPTLTTTSTSSTTSTTTTNEGEGRALPAGSEAAPSLAHLEAPHRPTPKPRLKLLESSELEITTVGAASTQGHRARHKSTARVLDPPSPLPQVDGTTSTPPLLYTTTHLHLHTSTPYTTTTTSTEAPTEPPVGPQWPPPPGPWACGPDTTDPTTTCTLCGANPWDLDHSTPGWGGLCPSCLFTVNNPP